MEENNRKGLKALRFFRIPFTHDRGAAHEQDRAEESSMYTTEKTLKHIADYPIRAINLLDYRRNPATVDELHQKGYRVIVRDQDGVDKYDFPPFTLDEIVIDEDFSDSSIG